MKQNKIAIYQIEDRQTQIDVIISEEKDVMVKVVVNLINQNN